MKSHERMKLLYLKSVLFLLFIGVASFLKAQTFTNGNYLHQGVYNSGGCVGFTDMDGDGFDDDIPF